MLGSYTDEDPPLEASPTPSGDLGGSLLEPRAEPSPHDDSGLHALVLVAALAVLVGLPTVVYFLLGIPEFALPSEWSDAQTRINDGTLPSGTVVDIVAVVAAVIWLAALALLATSLVKWLRRRSLHKAYASIEAHSAPPTDEEPWYRQGEPLFDQPFTDEPTKVIPGTDEPTDGANSLDDEPPPSASVFTDEPPLETGTASFDPAHGAPAPPMAYDDHVSHGEIVARPGVSASSEPPMIIPVRAYYMTRADDTLRSISAQFLNTPSRWAELRSLNAAYPGIAAAGPDTLLPLGSALALPGDPLPWGKPDPVYLWTLAEKFLFTAWGREPAPEEVVPFWRGLTSGSRPGAQPDLTSLAGMGAPPGIPAFGAATGPQPAVAHQPPAAPPEPAPDAPAAYQPPAYPQPPVDEPAPDAPEPAYEAADYEPLPSPEPAAPAYEPPTFEPSAATPEPAAYEAPPTFETPAAHEAPPTFETPAAHEAPPTFETPAAHEAPPTFAPRPPTRRPRHSKPRPPTNPRPYRPHRYHPATNRPR